MCCDMRSMATVFSAPRGTITSAYFFVGRQNSSKAGLTSVVYWEGRILSFLSFFILMCSFFDCLWLQGLYLVEHIFEIPSPVPDVPRVQDCGNYLSLHYTLITAADNTGYSPHTRYAFVFQISALSGVSLASASPPCPQPDLG